MFRETEKARSIEAAARKANNQAAGVGAIGAEGGDAEAGAEAEAEDDADGAEGADQDDV